VCGLRFLVPEPVINPLSVEKDKNDERFAVGLAEVKSVSNELVAVEDIVLKPGVLCVRDCGRLEFTEQQSRVSVNDVKVYATVLKESGAEVAFHGCGAQGDARYEPTDGNGPIVRNVDGASGITSLGVLADGLTRVVAEVGVSVDVAGESAWRLGEGEAIGD
jgi:hypothetical protein